MKEDDFRIIASVGFGIWSNEARMRKLFNETYGKILEAKISDFNVCKQQLEKQIKLCGLKLQKTSHRNLQNPMKFLLEKVHEFKVDALSDEENTAIPTPSIIHHLKGCMPLNKIAMRDDSLCNISDRIEGEPVFKTPVSSPKELARKVSYKLGLSNDTCETPEYSLINSCHMDIENSQIIMPEYNNNEQMPADVTPQRGSNISMREKKYVGSFLKEAHPDKNTILNISMEDHNHNISQLATSLSNVSISLTPILLKPITCPIDLFKYKPLPIIFPNESTLSTKSDIKETNVVSYSASDKCSVVTSPIEETYVKESASPAVNNICDKSIHPSNEENDEDETVIAGDTLFSPDLSLNRRIANALYTPIVNLAKTESRKAVIPSTPLNYVVDDLSSSDETDSAENPRKEIPIWAQDKKVFLTMRYLHQCLSTECIEHHFGQIHMPNMEEIFANYPNKQRYKKSGEVTAEWDSPLSDPRIGKSRYKKRRNAKGKSATKVSLNIK